jgi:hypothetical protein
MTGELYRNTPFTTRTTEVRYEENGIQDPELPTFYSITPIFRINSDREPSAYAQNPDNWIFL